MPELAEVEYYRRQWDVALGERIVAVKLHAQKRIFRGVNVRLVRRVLPDSVFLKSESRGKQLLFQFSNEIWLGLHLGMTGELTVGSPCARPGKHEHLVLVQEARALVFSDPRQFGRVQFHQGVQPPGWWANLPPAVNSPQFSQGAMVRFLRRHGRLALKPALLLQAGFPGIGNWMADEILWRARLHPLMAAGDLSPAEEQALWRSLRFVCRGALKHVAPAFADPPRGWLFHERWGAGGRCPIHGRLLNRRTVGGRTTAWCGLCQGSEKIGDGS